jgi:hypothetical protein
MVHYSQYPPIYPTLFLTCALVLLICSRRDLHTLRDLTAAHLPLLISIRDNGAKVCSLPPRMQRPDIGCGAFPSPCQNALPLSASMSYTRHSVNCCLQHIAGMWKLMQNLMQH